MRRLILPALGAVVALGLLAPGASAHQGNPNMESIVRAVTPATPGLSLQVLNLDDRFELTNRSGKDILIYGYEGEPYARVLADGTVQENVNSPAYYLNSERDGNVPVPASAAASATPRGTTLDRTGTVQWHDHRMHYMGKGVPPGVKDTSTKQALNDYTIPIKVGDAAGRISGTLWWTPQKDGGPPAGALVALVVLVLAGVGAVVVVRRRRRRTGDDDDAGRGRGPSGGATTPEAPVEAW
jgi:hypothetical protein